MVRAASGGTTVDIRVVPRSSRSGVAGTRDDAVLVHVTAPPADGAANAELLRVLADALALPQRAVTLERGASARRKVVRVAGLTPETVRARLALP